MRKRSGIRNSTPFHLTRVRLVVFCSTLAIFALVGCGNAVGVPSRHTPTPRVQLTTAAPDTPTPRTHHTASATDAATPHVSPSGTASAVGGPRASVTVNRRANLHRGPGTAYASVGSVSPGDVVTVVGQNAAGDWYRLASGAWIAAFLVDGAPVGLPVVDEPAATAPTTTTPAAAHVPTDAVAARLARVVDGDTIEVTIAGRSEKVRYIGIDTPERDQPGYRAASNANAALLGAGALYLVTDASDRDRYGRLLRYVYTGDGTLVNHELIARGWAQPVEYPPDIRFAEEFRQAARTAAQAGRGFWSGTAVDGAMPYALTTGNADLRRGPGAAFAARATLPANTPLTVFARTPDGAWLQVRAPDRSGGWIAAGQVTLAVTIDQVAVARDIPTLP